MEIREILARCDHTLLRRECTADEIRLLCDQAVQYRCASVCIPPAHVAGAAKYLGGRVPVCMVIGFPNGYATTAAKAFEAGDAIAHGANEVDMVVNLGMIRDRCWGDVLADIRAVRSVSRGKILKVIIETCMLSEEEKIRMCSVVSDSGADYIKTSTGFGKAGAQLEDIALFKAHIGENVRIKAAGGIRTREDMEAFLDAGCDRIGCSAARILFDEA